MNQLKFSRRWCRWWVPNKLNFSFRRGTSSGQKLSANWESECEDMRARAAVIASSHGVVHPALVINWDQTGLLMMPTATRTYSDKGSKQVEIAKLDDKRQITAVVASAMDGSVLPVQLVFAGKEFSSKTGNPLRSSCPNDADTLQLLEQHKWSVTQTDSHWSNVNTMKDYVKTIIDPYVQSKIKELDLPENKNHALLIFDVFWAHRDTKFTEWLKENYPNYHYVFIPANCTSVLQPADVLLNRPFKCELTNQYTNWSTQNLMSQFSATDDISNIRLPNDLTTLKPLIVKWSIESWLKLKQYKEMIRHGWKKLLGKILDPEFQIDCLQRIGRQQLSVEEPVAVPDDAALSASDKMEEEEDDDNRTEEENPDEEEIDTLTALMSCVENLNVDKENYRRTSARLARMSATQRDARIAQLMQDDVYNSACSLGK